MSGDAASATASARELVGEDRVLEERTWAVQRAAWAVWAGVLACALAGVFGRGPVSGREVRSGDGALTVRYDRFVRSNAPSVVEIELRARDGGTEVGDDGRDGLTWVWFDRALLERASLECATPEPRETDALADRFALGFKTSELAAGAALVRLRFDIEKPGAMSGAIGLGERRTEAGTVTVKQFAYP